MDSHRRRRDSRLLVGAVGLSAAGDFLALIPLVAAVQERSGSGLVVSGFFIALWGPSVLLARISGRLVDSIETTRLLTVASLIQAGLAVALIGFTDSTAVIIVLITLLGSANAVSQPAEFSLAPAIADGEALKILNGNVETARYLGMTAGPLLGGALGAAGGIGVALAVDAATFVFVALAARALHARRLPESAAGPGEEDGEDRRDSPQAGGLATLFADPVLATVMAVTFFSLVLMTGVATAEVFFARETLGGGDAGYGLLLTAWTLGMATGALLLSRRIASGALATAALVMIAVQGAGLALPTLWLSLAFAAVLYAVGGIGHGTKNVLIRTLIHERVAVRSHGRAAAAYNALRNGAELFALAAGGLLVEAFGARATLAFCGAVPIVVALVGLSRLRMREDPPRQPAPAAP